MNKDRNHPNHCCLKDFTYYFLTSLMHFIFVFLFDVYIYSFFGLNVCHPNWLTGSLTCTLTSDKISHERRCFRPFSGGGSVEDISSIILSYYEQEFHFLSLRIDFLKTKMTLKNDQFWPWNDQKIGHFGGHFWFQKVNSQW